MKRAHGSGESDDQVMERAHAIYKIEAKEKPFTFDYLPCCGAMPLCLAMPPRPASL